MRAAAWLRCGGLLLAATSLATGLLLYTRNGDDFQTLDDLIEVIVV